jgi:acyl-coenzyme A thioesterase PaaI-like protein
VIETGIQHTNGADFLHGGFIMSYADMVYFAIAWRSLEDVMSVTLTSTFEFVGAGRAGIPLEATGDVVKETGKLIFVRALITQNGDPVCMTTATLRKISPRPKRLDA